MTPVRRLSSCITAAVCGLCLVAWTPPDANAQSYLNDAQRRTMERDQQMRNDIMRRMEQRSRRQREAHEASKRRAEDSAERARRMEQDIRRDAKER